MKAKVEIEVRPFCVPDTVTLIAQQGEAMAATMPLSALDAETLDEMCDEFRREIFKRAKKNPPPICVAG